MSWFSEVRRMLRTFFCQIKHVFGTENYSLYSLSKRKRSLWAQIRSGILPLHIEAGRAARRIGCDSLMELKMTFILFCIVRFITICDYGYSREFTYLLAWLFKYITFVIADFIEKAFPKRKMYI